ncbi:MAG: OmpA family protein [Crocinitomicaceae bacterium]|nr:OmpA family protein [Crocinitomicaceae bacterium]MBP6032370.1 OmpA family protein [Crocinitomicaceae bacterium]
MKKLIFAFATVMSFMVTAQDYNKCSIGFNIGGHDGMSRTNHSTKIYQLSHMELNSRYMLNNRFGIKFDVATDKFNFKDGHPATNAVRFSIQPTFSLTDVLHMNDFSKRLGMFIHTGGAYAAMWNKTLVTGPKELFNANDGSVDEMIQGILGLTTQIKISERMSVNADISFMANIRQNNGFDFEAAPISGGGFSGYYATASIGFNYYIGKAKTHADWTYTPRMNQADLNRIAALEKQATEVASKLADDDNDGVINAVDQEANTPAGNAVDVTGKTVVPTPAPDLNTIDTDGDGFVDGKDECPTVKGDVKGCPEEHSAEKDAKTLNDSGIYDIMFVKGSSVINPTYNSIMDKLVSYMAANPTQTIAVTGHTDTDGADEMNNKLSEARVNAVVSYLTSKGVNKNRLVISYKGKKETKYAGNTLEVDAANRRVQFSIVR